MGGRGGMVDGGRGEWRRRRRWMMGRYESEGGCVMGEGGMRMDAGWWRGEGVGVRKGMVGWIRVGRWDGRGKEL